MIWNYRVTLHHGMWGDECEIRGVYYDDAGEVTSWTADGVRPYGDTPEELRADLELMLGALDKPTLVLDDLEVEIARRRAAK